MHVLHIITGLSDGGAEAILYRMCKFDKEYKHTVISLMGKQKYGPMLTNIGVDVHALDFPKGKMTPVLFTMKTQKNKLSTLNKLVVKNFTWLI